MIVTNDRAGTFSACRARVTASRRGLAGIGAKMGTCGFDTYRRSLLELPAHHSSDQREKEGKSELQVQHRCCL